MHLNAILLSLMRFTEPGLMAFTNLHRITPSLSTSKKLSISPLVLIGSPVISFTHSRHSAANSSLYFELIWKKNRKTNRISISILKRSLMSLNSNFQEEKTFDTRDVSELYKNFDRISSRSKSEVIAQPRVQNNEQKYRFYF